MLHEGSDSKRLDVIFDVDRENPIKNAEREKRGAEFGNKLETFSSNTRCKSG